MKDSSLIKVVPIKKKDAKINEMDVFDDLGDYCGIISEKNPGTVIKTNSIFFYILLCNGKLGKIEKWCVNIVD